MDASKITFGEKTLESLSNPVMKPKRRTELRKKIIKEWINSKPYGTPLSMTRAAQILRYGVTPERGASAANALIQRMVKKGELYKFKNPRGPGYYYTVGRPVATVSAPKTVDEKKTVDERKPEPETAKEETVQPDRYTFDELEKLAMKFVFYSPDHHVSGFLSWLKKT